MPNIHQRNASKVNQGKGLSLWLKDLTTHTALGPCKRLFKHRKLLSKQARSDLLKQLVAQKQWDLATTLILEGVTILVDERGYTLLHHMVESGSYLAVNYLLGQESIPDLFLKTKEGATFLDLAIRSGNPLIIEGLIKEGARETNLECGKELWFQFAKHGCHEELEELLKQYPKIDVNSRTEKGSSALQCAMKEQNWSSARILLKHGASSRTKDAMWSPLHYAAYYGRVSFVRLIYKNDPAINSQISEVQSGYSPLHLACQRGHFHVAKYLLRHGADANCIDASGNTIFHVLASIKKFNKELCKTLKKFIDPSLLNKNELTALEVAFENENSEFLRFFFCDFPEILDVLPEKNNSMEFLLDSNICSDILAKVDDDPCEFVSQFYKDDSNDRTKALLSFAFLLCDEELARYVVSHGVSEKQYRSVIRFIKKTYPAAQLDFLEEACLVVDPSHLKVLQNKTLSEPKSNVDIEILKKLFQMVNFEQEKIPGYIDTESMQSEGVITVDSLKEGINLLVDRTKKPHTIFRNSPCK